MALFQRRVDDRVGHPGQGSVSRFRSIQKQNVGGDIHDFLIVGESRFFERESSLLKAVDKLRRSRRAPMLQKYLSNERRDRATKARDELPVGLGKRADLRTLVRIALASRQRESVTSGASLLTGNAARLQLRGCENSGLLRLLPEH